MEIPNISPIYNNSIIRVSNSEEIYNQNPPNGITIVNPISLIAVKQTPSSVNYIGTILDIKI